MTFCPFYKDCADGSECFRALTPEEKERANAEWGGQAPIMQFMSKPDCHEPINTDECQKKNS